MFEYSTHAPRKSISNTTIHKTFTELKNNILKINMYNVYVYHKIWTFCHLLPREFAIELNRFVTERKSIKASAYF